VAEVILFGGALHANRRWIGRELPGTKEEGEKIS
jgi:hypothetical protein